MLANKKSNSVLFVDDDESVRAVIAWLLEDAGYVVHIVSDAASALGFLETHPEVDVVLSDINMPDMNGIQLRDEVKRRWPSLPVLLTSGRPPPPGEDTFIAKPFDFLTLLTWLHRLVVPAADRGVYA